MFTLRRITSEGAEINHNLGERYNLILEERTPDHFQKTLKDFGWGNEDLNIYGFVVGRDGSEIIPLYKKSIYFVMTESGRTFDNITFK